MKTKIQELIENPKVQYIRNTKSPAGVYVELKRDSSGKCIEFIQTFPTGNIRLEQCHDRGILYNNVSPDWNAVTVKELEVIKSDGQKFIRQPISKDVKVDLNVVPNQTPSPKVTKELKGE